jgi:uncharacterized protein YbaP (TraB family)
MKKTILTTLLVLAAITINAQFLFRINGRGLQKPSYILGSVHTMPGTILDSIPEFLKAEAECQQLYAEYDLSSQQKMDEVKTAGQQATTLPDGKTIFDVLKPEQLDALNYRFKETFQVSLTDSAMKATWNYQPFVFPSTFAMIFTLTEMQKHPELTMTGTPLDAVCITRAKERGMTFGQLDQVQSQDSLTKMRNTWMENIDSQVDSLMSFLDHFEERKQQSIDEVLQAVTVAKYWKLGDYNSFDTDSFWISQLEKNPALFKQRNEKWLPKITGAIQQAPTLFVFGAGHLIGKDGIVNKLREAGYKVEQIKTN